MRIAFLMGAVGVGLALSLGTVGDAQACGGCFHPVGESGNVITDHRMIFAISPQQTTLYDEIEYQGSPSSFAWVLPIHGPVTVGLSSDTLFAALDQVTQPSILPPPLPQCPQPANCVYPPVEFGAASGPAADASAVGVTVISQAVVGPYDTVQLKSTDPNALTAWLTNNGYSIPQDVQPVIAEYVNEGFDFLALRLAPGNGVQAMRPVSVTTPGAGLSLPLRMVAVGTGATVGVKLWVVSDARYEPQNFQSFVISPSDLIWDWSKNDSNNSTLRVQKEAALNNAAWQIESSLDVAPYQVENLMFGSPGGFPGVSSSVSSSGLPGDSSGYTAIPASDAGPGETADQARQQDLANLFPSGQAGVRITRMRADLARAALATDLTLMPSSIQTTLSNQYQVTQSIHAPACPSPPVCACGGSAFGSGSGSSSPIQFGTGGSGSVLGGSDAGITDPLLGEGNGQGTQATPGSGDKLSGGCSESPSEPNGTGTDLALVGLVGISLIRKRSRGKIAKQ